MDFAIPEKMSPFIHDIREFIRSEVYPLEQHFGSKRFTEMSSHAGRKT